MNPSFIPLHTERLILRELTPDDTPALAQILGDAEVMRHSVAGVLSEKATGEFIDWCQFSYRERGFGPWAVVEKSTSTLAGFCGLNAERVDEKDEIEIGYRLATRFWGKGLGTEAARSAVAYGFEALQVPSLIAIVQPTNLASVKVIKKLGFGGFVHSQYHRQGVRIYRMTAQQWALGGSAELA
ncbi:GNAT family N-acetyltransferase [Pseudomonas sp. KU26590]|uniref:GNAT family N-acetyltransferase n=1 Tax=Pseudomonas sp. KU26590 TaxID=2991051 RepID=UPI00223E2FB8|nr:GNAT family N-acetyltransferase [Pseudomonas sp. KU26590]UZJ61700.1 GNAT family N-acetyltransferase [Pseudomonas sp. KU26590]